MRAADRSISIRRRLVALSLLWVSLLVIAFAWHAHWRGRQQLQQLDAERQHQLGLVASTLQHLLREHLSLLSNFAFRSGIDLDDADWMPERRALHEAQRSSLFHYGLFLRSRSGIAIVPEPNPLPIPSETWSITPPTRPTVSPLQWAAADRPFIVMVAPLKDPHGQTRGLIGGVLDPTHPHFQSFLPPRMDGTTTVVDVVDDLGQILLSTDVTRRATHQGTMAIAPRAQVRLELAPWTVVDRSDLTADSRRTQRWPWLAVTGLGLGIGLLFALGMARSVTLPIGQLQACAHAIAHGDLTRVVPDLGSDELGRLGESLEAMRQHLLAWTDTLEHKIQERTKKIVTAQEEERRRIARELHDDLSQLVVVLLLKLEMRQPAAAKALANEILDALNRLIRNLRPALLDDMGLATAVRWLVERQLTAEGIAVDLAIDDTVGRFPPEIEVALYRIIQEALMNIFRHAAATHVSLQVTRAPDHLRVVIADNGRGFDPSRDAGLGLAGLHERVALINGTVRIRSAAQHGTHLSVEIPWHGTDSTPHR